VVGLPLGWRYGGLEGFVWVTALSEIPVLAVLWPAFRRAGLLSPLREARAVGFFAGGAMAGVGVAWIARAIHP